MLLITLHCINFGYAALLSADEEALKVAFVYNFAKFSEWPVIEGVAGRESLLICVLGRISFQRHLAVIDGKAVGNQHVVVEYLHDLLEISRCHILLAGELEANARTAALGAAQPFPVLTISDQRDFILSGGMVELFETGQQLRFKVNREKIEAAGIKLSSHVLKLAITIQP